MSPIRRNFATAYEPLTFQISNDNTIVDSGVPFGTGPVWLGFNQCTTLTNSDILVQDGSWDATTTVGQKDGPIFTAVYWNTRTSSGIDPADYGINDVTVISSLRRETETTSRAGDVTVPAICPAGEFCNLGQTISGTFQYPEMTRVTQLDEDVHFIGQSASAKIEGPSYALTPGTITYRRLSDNTKTLVTGASSANYELTCTSFTSGDKWKGDFFGSYNGDLSYDVNNSASVELISETPFHILPDIVETLTVSNIDVTTFTETINPSGDYTYDSNNTLTSLTESFDWAKPTIGLDGVIYKKSIEQETIATADNARPSSSVTYPVFSHSPIGYGGFFSAFDFALSNGPFNITRDRTITTDKIDQYEVAWADSAGSIPLKSSQIDNNLRGAVAGGGIDLQSVSIGQILTLDVNELTILAKPTQEVRTDLINVGSGTTPQPTVVTKTQLPFWDEFVGMEFRLSQLISAGSNRYRKVIATVVSYDSSDTLTPNDFNSNDMRTITELRLRVDRIIGTESFEWRLPPDETDTDLIHYVAQGGYIEHALFNSAFSTESSTDNRSSIVKVENEPDVLARIFYANSSPNPDNLSQWGVPAIFTIMSNGDVIRRDRSIKGGIFKIPAAFNFTDPFTVHYTRAD